MYPLTKHYRFTLRVLAKKIVLRIKLLILYKKFHIDRIIYNSVKK